MNFLEKAKRVLGKREKFKHRKYDVLNTVLCTSVKDICDSTSLVNRNRVGEVTRSLDRVADSSEFGGRKGVDRE